jgi:hypothetical protein
MALASRCLGSAHDPPVSQCLARPLVPAGKTLITKALITKPLITKPLITKPFITEALIAMLVAGNALFRRVEVRKQPAQRVGLHGVAGHEHLPGVIAGRTFECAHVEARRSGLDLGKQHAGLAGGAKRTLESGNLDAVRRGARFGHDASPGSGASAIFSFAGGACRSGGDGTNMIAADSCSLLKNAQFQR